MTSRAWRGLDARPGTTARPRRADGARSAIHPADVHGRFIRARRIVFARADRALLALPVVRIGGHPAVHLDVARRRFFLFGGDVQRAGHLARLLPAIGVASRCCSSPPGSGASGAAGPARRRCSSRALSPDRALIDGPRERGAQAAGAPWTAGQLGRCVVKHAAVPRRRRCCLARRAQPVPVGAASCRRWCARPGAHPAAFAWAMAITGRALLQLRLVPRAALHRDLPLRAAAVGAARPRLAGRSATTPQRGEPRAAKRRCRSAGGDRGDCVDCKRCVVGLPDRHRHPQRAADGVHRLRAVHRRVRRGDGQDRRAARPDPLHVDERAGRSARARAGGRASRCTAFAALLAVCAAVAALAGRTCSRRRWSASRASRG